MFDLLIESAAAAIFMAATCGAGAWWGARQARRLTARYGPQHTPAGNDASPYDWANDPAFVDEPHSTFAAP